MPLVLWIEVVGLTRLDSSTLYSFLYLLNVTWLTMALWSLFTGEQVSSYLYWQLIFVTYLTHLFICSYRFTFHYFYFLCFGLFFCCVRLDMISFCHGSIFYFALLTLCSAFNNGCPEFFKTSTSSSVLFKITNEILNFLVTSWWR